MVGANPYQTLPTADYDLRSAPIPPSASQLPPPDQFAFSTTLRKANPDDPYTSAASTYPPFASPPRPANHKPNASDASQPYATSIEFRNASSASSSRSAAVSASAHYTHLSVDQCLESLHCPSLESGLTPLLVHEARSEAGGYNEFAVRAGEEPWRKFLAQFQEPLILLLLAALPSACSSSSSASLSTRSKSPKSRSRRSTSFVPALLPPRPRWRYLERARQRARSRRRRHL
ncbi:hypothetical protein L1887_42348 [Cichorium endivia]|nr:hypothetical protein L1887_42348 [Cichorium endivia]